MLEWTWSGSDPAYWSDQTSADGVSGWVEADLLAGNARSAGGREVGTYHRLVGLDSGHNPVTAPSNAVYLAS